MQPKRKAPLKWGTVQPIKRPFTTKGIRWREGIPDATYNPGLYVMQRRDETHFIVELKWLERLPGEAGGQGTYLVMEWAEEKIRHELGSIHPLPREFAVVTHNCGPIQPQNLTRKG